MSVFPLVVSCEGDFAPLLVPAPAGGSIDEVAQFAARTSLYFRVPEPARTLRLRPIGSAEPLARGTTLEAAGVRPMDWLHLYYE